MTWLNNSDGGSAVEAVPNQDENGLWPWLVPGNSTGGEALAMVMETNRPSVRI